MGLWELLNKPLFCASNEYVVSWHEPRWWGMRLRNDWWLRLAIVPIGAVLVAGLTLLVIGFTERVPQHFEWSGLLYFALFGAVAAGFVAIFAWSHDDDRGAAAARDDELYVRRSEAALGSLMRIVTITWPYSAIDQCVIVPGRSLGKSFSVMVVASRGKVDLIAVARYVDPDQLARHLAARGVHVSFADALPAKFMAPYYPPKIIGGLAAATAVIFLIGLAVGHRHFGPPQAEAQQANAGRQNAAAMKNPRDAAVPGREFPRPDAAVPAGDAAAGRFGEPNDPPPEATPAAPATPPGLPQIGTPFGPGGGSRMQRGRPFGRSGIVADPFGPVVKSQVAPAAPDVPPASTPADPNAKDGRKTELVGGDAPGVAFQSPPADGLVNGVAYRIGQWAGEPGFADIQPLRNATPPQGFEAIVAREGYAVGGITADTGKFFHAMQVTFMRIRPDGGLDPNDSYKSDWIGTLVGQTTNTVSCKGAKTIGLHGQRMALVHAIGLVLE